ncbi:hypothetical protein BJ508DRAFT_328954 [Ascobolus immersus RN42]|uniref:F-box domain-containing protein n=1 Tax=Ascobolus immersus RN42 TaxID=1160509 RepID=A0A3N4HYN0_ASCIM|nr:hypothetical protein BJ508DRAFT_328954 [Ascobolus immersus RN42]
MTKQSRRRRHLRKKHANAGRKTILNLPAEIRLEIYGHCSALSVLVLSNTCRTFQSEILSHPSIYKAARNYVPFFDPNLGFGKFTMGNVCKAADRSEYLLVLRMIGVNYADKYYAPPKTLPSYGCCQKCFEIVQFGDLIPRYNPKRTVEVGERYRLVCGACCYFRRRDV